jgi:hypothetical protein
LVGALRQCRKAQMDTGRRTVTLKGWTGLEAAGEDDSESTLSVTIVHSGMRGAGVSSSVGFCTTYPPIRAATGGTKE